MTQKEVDKIIAQTVPQIQQLLKIEADKYTLLRYETELMWLQSVTTEEIYRIANGSTIYWNWFYVMYLRFDLITLSNTDIYTAVDRSQAIKIYVMGHVAYMPAKIPPKVMFDILKEHTVTKEHKYSTVLRNKKIVNKKHAINTNERLKSK